MKLVGGGPAEVQQAFSWGSHPSKLSQVIRNKPELADVHNKLGVISNLGGNLEDAAEQRALVPAEQTPIAFELYPCQGKAHKALAKTGIAGFAAKGRVAADVAGVTDYQAIYVARDPLKEFP